MPETPREQLARVLAGYPSNALPYFSRTFATAGQLSEQDRKKVVEALLDAMQRGKHQFNGDALRSLTDLSSQEAEEIATVYSVAIGLLSDTTATPDDFVAEGRGKLFTSEHDATALSIAQAICNNREQISKAIQRARLGGAVLPSLRKFEVATDFRVQVVKNELKMGVPLVVVHIDTDADGQEVWLQLSRLDVDDIIKKLTNCLDDMAVADKLAIPSK
jgi:hypothetical protein